MHTNSNRSSFKRMMKSGKLRALRNIPVGWLTQSVHSTDTTERIVRIIVEFALIMAAVFIYAATDLNKGIFSFVLLVGIVHTITWFLFGNFWVYMLDSFNWVDNGGIEKVLNYIELVRRVHEKRDICDAVLIYGSMSRAMFHVRSDLDLRIIRRTDSAKGYLAVYYAFLLKAYAFVLRMPVDYQVADSFDFLKMQMRDDEKPIIVYKRPGFVVANEGVSIEEVVKNPEIVLKKFNRIFKD